MYYIDSSWANLTNTIKYINNSCSITGRWLQTLLQEDIITIRVNL